MSNKDQIRDIKNHLETLETNKEKLQFLYELKMDRELYHKWGIGISKEQDFMLKFVELEIKDLEKPGTGAEVQTIPDKRFKHPQQMLLLERLGIIKFLDQYNLTGEKKALLISKFIGKHQQNTRNYLIYMDQKSHYNCNTKENNDLINQLFTELGISGPL